jgi:hypothetical protein
MFRHTVFAAVLCASAVAHAQVSIGSASARPGQRAFGALEVRAGSDTSTTIPVIVVNGAKPGRTVAFVSGAHGTEYASIVALTRLGERIDPAALLGTVIIAPLLNIPSFERMTVHVNPVDGKGMNASYPGDAQGTQTQRALTLVADQIVKPADVVVDLHGGDLDEDLRPYSYWIRTGNPDQDSTSKNLVLAFGLDHIIVRDVDTTNPASTRSLSGYALSLGKTSIVAEAGRSGLVLEADVNALVDGSLNVLGALGMLRRPVRSLTRVTWLGGGARVRAEGGGIFLGTVSRDTRVTKGQAIGTITDYWGRKTSEVVAPIEGLVTFVRGVPSLWKDATIVDVATILPDPPPAYRKPAPQ